MEQLTAWLDANKISFRQIDKEVIEIEGFGKMLLADTSGVQSIFRERGAEIVFNLMEDERILIEEGIFHAAFPFGRNWYYYDLREPFRFNILKYTGKRQPSPCDVPYVNLGIHTPYELLNGSGDLTQWITKAKHLGHTAIGICDRNTMAATLNLQKECEKAGIKYVFGYSFTLAHNGGKADMKIYCQTQQGLENLLRIQKEVMVDSADNTLSLKGLTEHAQGNVLVFGKLSSHWMGGNAAVVSRLKEAFGKVFYQVDLGEYKADRIDIEALKATGYFFHNFYDSQTGSFEVEPILISDCYYLDKDDAHNKIILNKIASGAAHEQSDDQYFKDAGEQLEAMRRVFDPGRWDVERLFERMCRHTVGIAKGAGARFETGRMYMPQYIMLPDEVVKYRNRHNMFLRLLDEGLKMKVPPEDHAGYKERLAGEVYIIESTNNIDYFLVQWDMIREAHRRGIATGVGRGSAGGSLVSYLLGITSIDPIRYDLMFSRFLVPERCGLNWTDAVSIIGEDIVLTAGEKYVEVAMNGSVHRFFPAAELTVRRDGQEIRILADQLNVGDDIMFDQRDLIWTLNELNNDGQSVPVRTDG